MRLPLDIAMRYLFGKKSTNAINIINWISIIGMAIGTAALILILSVFNGFEGVLIDTLGKYNPDLKVSPQKGVYLSLNVDHINQIKQIQGVEAISKVIEEVALFEYNQTQVAGIIKGVEGNYAKVIDFSSALVQGDLKTQDSIGSLAVLGSGIADRLSISINDPFNDLSVYIPKASSVGLDLPFVAGSLIPSSIFSFGGEQDGQIVISDLNFVQNLTNKSGKFSGLEIKILKNASSEKIKNSILKISNDPVLVKDRYELDEAFLKVMNIERWVAFLIAMLTLGIISFNMVGSLWMIVLDKKKDISLLKSIGMTSSDIKKVFRNIGFYIGVIGFVIGLIVALILYFLQKKYNLISVPDGFIMQGYPIEMKIWDVILVFFTVVLIAVLASLLPAVRASKISAFVRQE